VALERQSIEKKDFPFGRRGYDPEAVDAHLSAIADEVDELKRASRRRTETLASAASDQVRAIVEAAENSAAQIQRQAEEEAQEIRADAASEAQATREQATGQAREYVGKVSESTAVMLQRLDAMESELSALIDTLRTGSNRLNADLQLLEGNLVEVTEAVTPRPKFEPEVPGETISEPAGYAASEPAGGFGEAVTDAGEPAAGVAEPGVETITEPVAHEPEPAAHEAEPAAHEAEPASEVAEPAHELGGYGEPSAYGETASYTEPAAHAESTAHDEPAAGVAEPAAAGEPAEAGGATASEAVSDDTEGARLIALNMALNGTPREETDRYLAENFQLADRAGLLDEVYASVEG